MSSRDKELEQLWLDESFDRVDHPVVVFQSRSVNGPLECHHLQVQHDYWVSRGYVCPYCRVGSKICSREDVNRGLRLR